MFAQYMQQFEERQEKMDQDLSDLEKSVETLEDNQERLTARLTETISPNIPTPSTSSSQVIGQQTTSQQQLQPQQRAFNQPLGGQQAQPPIEKIDTSLNYTPSMTSIEYIGQLPIILLPEYTTNQIETKSNEEIRNEYLLISYLNEAIAKFQEFILKLRDETTNEVLNKIYTGEKRTALHLWSNIYDTIRTERDQYVDNISREIETYKKIYPNTYLNLNKISNDWLKIDLFKVREFVVFYIEQINKILNQNIKFTIYELDEKPVNRLVISVNKSEGQANIQGLAASKKIKLELTGPNINATHKYLFNLIDKYIVNLGTFHYNRDTQNIEDDDIVGNVGGSRRSSNASSRTATSTFQKPPMEESSQSATSFSDYL